MNVLPIVAAEAVELHISRSCSCSSCHGSDISGCRSMQPSRNLNNQLIVVRKGMNLNSHMHQDYQACEVGQSILVCVLTCQSHEVFGEDAS